MPCAKRCGDGCGLGALWGGPPSKAPALTPRASAVARSEDTGNEKGGQFCPPYEVLAPPIRICAMIWPWSEASLL